MATINNNSPYKITNLLNIKTELKEFYNNLGYCNCLRCKKKLTDPNSMIKRFGPVCYKIVNKNNKIIQLDLTFNNKSIDLKHDVSKEVKK